MNIKISNKSDLPIYEQLKIQVKEKILCGQLSENQFLPSIRQLAKDLGVSVITTSRAYNDLEHEGFVSTIQGKGTYVLRTDNNLIKEEYLKRIEEAFSQAIESAKVCKIDDEELIFILKNIIENSK